ncbi:hypothetical protein [Kibdelosporangium aridum]|uniref:hypothetical protein n=1 Tax=Kibdelosporangium aridum TaxID=2030 RepID=UPI0005273604
MVGVLIRMRLSVARHSLRREQLITSVGKFLLGLLAAGLTIGLAAGDFRTDAITADMVALAFLAWFICWIVVPMLAGGGDETLRPEHFSLLPITSRQLAVGLLGIAFIGPGAVVTLVAGIALVVLASGLGTTAVVFAVPALVLQTAFFVLLARVVIAALGAALRSRRGRDIALLLVAFICVCGFLLRYPIQSLGPSVIRGEAPGFSAVLHVLPSGWATSAVEAAGRSDWLIAVGALLGLAALVGLLLLAWAPLIERRTTTRSASGRYQRTRSGVLTRLLPTSPLGAVAYKEILTWSRDARRRAVLVTSLAALPGAVVPALSGIEQLLPFGGMFVLALACAETSNLYGLDGSGMWHTILAPNSTRADVRGRQLAWTLVVAPFCIALTLVLTAISGLAWAWPWVLALLPALVGGCSGAVVLLSVIAAYPVPKNSDSNPFTSGTNPHYMQLSIIPLLIAMVGPALALLIQGAVTGNMVLSWLAVPVGVITGAVMAWLCGRIACQKLEEGAVELFGVVRQGV